MISAFDLDSTIPEWALAYRFDVVLRGREATPHGGLRWRCRPRRRRRSGRSSTSASTAASSAASWWRRTARTRCGCSGSVSDGEGEPVIDAMIEIWQANAAGRYAHAEDTREDLPLEDGFDGFGRACTDDDGRYEFVTVKPGAGARPGRQPAGAAHRRLGVRARAAQAARHARSTSPTRRRPTRPTRCCPRSRTPRRAPPWWPSRTTAGYGSTSSCKATARPPSLPFERLFVPPAVREATGERAWLQAMLDFEVGARARRRHAPG